MLLASSGAQHGKATRCQQHQNVAWTPVQSWTAGALWAVHHPGSSLELLTPQAQVSGDSHCGLPLLQGEPGSRSTRVLA